MSSESNAVRPHSPADAAALVLMNTAKALAESQRAAVQAQQAAYAVLEATTANGVSQILASGGAA